MKPNFKVDRVDSPRHRKFVASQPCLITGSKDGVQAHHLLRTGEHGTGIKSSDIWCIPLHHTVHDALHKNGNEVVFFANHGRDYERVKEIARNLSNESPDIKIRMAMKIYQQNKED